MSRNVSPTGGHQGGRQESISQPWDLVGRGWGWRGFCVGAWLSQRWSCSAAPTPRVHFFISHGVGHLFGQAEDMRDLESSSQSIQLSLDYVAFDQLEAGTKAVPPECRLALFLSVSAEVCCHGSLTVASPLTDACSSSRLASFHLLVLPRTPTVPGPSCSVRPPAFPALKHIHVPRGVSSHCHCASLSRVHLVAQSCLTLATPWIVARQAPLSLGFSRQECWRRLSFPPPGDLPDPGTEPMSPVSPALQAVFCTR